MYLCISAISCSKEKTNVQSIEYAWNICFKHLTNGLLRLTIPVHLLTAFEHYDIALKIEINLYRFKLAKYSVPKNFITFDASISISRMPFPDLEIPKITTRNIQRSGYILIKKRSIKSEEANTIYFNICLPKRNRGIYHYAVQRIFISCIIRYPYHTATVFLKGKTHNFRL